MFALFTILLLNVICVAYSNYSGETCKITYGSGAISGFFSNDNVLVGDLVVKNQVNYELSIIIPHVNLQVLQL